METDKITWLRENLRNAVRAESSEAAELCRQLKSALEDENLNTWEPELCLLLLEILHLRPQQIPEHIEKLYFELTYLRTELPALSEEGNPDTVRRLGFSGPYAAFQEIIQWLDQFVQSNAVAHRFLSYSQSKLELGLIGPDGLESVCRVFALCAKIKEVIGDIYYDYNSLYEAGSAYSDGMRILGLEGLREQSRICDEVFLSLQKKVRHIGAVRESERLKEEKARKDREKAEAKQRQAAYWKEHSEEKAGLEAEQKELKAKAAELDRALADLENDAGAAAHGREFDRLSDREEELMKQRERLNVFQGGKKRSIERELVSVREAKWAAKEKRDKEIEEKEAKRRANRSQFAEIERRLSEIKKELTKPR